MKLSELPAADPNEEVHSTYSWEDVKSRAKGVVKQQREDTNFAKRYPDAMFDVILALINKVEELEDRISNPKPATSDVTCPPDCPDK